MNKLVSWIKGCLAKTINVNRVKIGKHFCCENIFSVKAHKDSMVRMGNSCRIRKGVSIDAVDGGNIKIGDHVSMNRNVVVASHTKI